MVVYHFDGYLAAKTFASQALERGPWWTFFTEALVVLRPYFHVGSRRIRFAEVL